MAIAGHVSQEMVQHYSHVRLKAKKRAVEKLSGENASQTGQNRQKKLSLDR